MRLRLNARIHSLQLEPQIVARLRHRVTRPPCAPGRGEAREVVELRRLSAQLYVGEQARAIITDGVVVTAGIFDSANVSPLDITGVTQRLYPTRRLGLVLGPAGV